MKKLISILICLAMFCSIIPLAMAEEALEPFDYKTILGSRGNYEYDKFDRRWSYYEAARYEFSDATVILGLDVQSEKNGSNPAMTSLYAKILDKEGNIFETVESIDLLIGEDIYSYDSMMDMERSSAVAMGRQGQKLIDALNETDESEITIRLGYGGSREITLEASEFRDFTGTIKEFCRVYNKYEIGKYVEDLEVSILSELYFPLRINGEIVSVENEENVA